MDSPTQGFRIPRKPVGAHAVYERLPQHHGPSTNDFTTEQFERNVSSFDALDSLVPHLTQTLDEAFRSSQDTQSQLLIQAPASKREHRGLNSTRTLFHDDISRSGKTGKKSIYLRSTTLYVICMVFVLLIVALITLYCISQDQRGLSITISSNHYAWKYGPTAILVLVVALWRQVDYHCKISAPWIELDNRKCTTTRSLFIDYVSPLQPVVLIKSIRHHDWAVAASVTTFALLKLVVLFSTGLLVAEQTSLTKSNISLPLSLVGSNSSIDTLSESGNDGGPSAAVTYYGTSEKGMDFPRGTNEVAAFQYPLAYNNIPTTATVGMEVSVFYPQYRCQPAQITYTNRENAHQNGSLLLQAAECTLGQTFNDIDLRCVPSRTKAACAQREIFTQTSYCNGSYSWIEGGYVPETPFFKYILGVDNNLTLAPNSSESCGYDCDIINYSQKIYFTAAVLCRPEYSVNEAVLTVDTAITTVKQSMKLGSPSGESGKHFKDYTVGQFAVDMGQVMLASEELDEIPFPTMPQGHQLPSSENEGIWFNGTLESFESDTSLMMMYASINSLEGFKDDDLLGSSFEAVYNGVAVQFVRQYLNFPSRPTTTANYTWTEQRLHVKDVSVWPMCLALLLCAGFVIVVMRAAEFAPGTQHANYLAWQLLVMRENPGLVEGLIRDSAVTHKVLRHSPERRLIPLNDLASQHSTQSSRLVDDEVARISKDGRLKQHWRPFPVSYAFISLSFVLPIAMIATLEGLQQRSDSMFGFADVLTSKATSEALATYLAAAVALLVAALYGSAEFFICMFAPYHSLARSGFATQNMLFSALGSLPPKALVKAVKERQISVALIMISSTIGALLTIFTSGLYTIAAVPQPYSVTVRLVDALNLDWDQSMAPNAMALFNLMMNYNASYPSGTHDEISYPFFQLDDADKTVSAIMKTDMQTSLEIELPVHRASLNCSVVSLDSIAISSFEVPGQYFPGQMVPVLMDLSFELPPACRKVGSSFHNATRLWTSTTQTTDLDSSGTIESLWPYEVDVSETSLPVYPPHCPSLAFIYGRYPAVYTAKELQHEWTDAYTTVLMCTQYMEEIPAAMSFSFPSMSLDLSQPPVLHEHRKRTISDHQYDVIFMMLNGFSAPTTLSTNNFTGASPIFEAAVFGPDGIPAWELEGLNNRDRLINATQHIYRQFMAQVMNDVMRVSTPAEAMDKGINGSSVNATLYDPSRLRLKQNNTSKLALQIVLAVMLVCFVVSYWIMRDMRRLLYENPCSIAGTMKLLAGTSLASDYAAGRDFDEGRDRGQEKTVQSNYDFDDDEEEFYRAIRNRRFRLGWWVGEKEMPSPSEQTTAEGEDDGGGTAGMELIERNTEIRRFGIDVLPDEDQISPRIGGSLQ